MSEETLTITRLGHRGDGIAQNADGGQILVPLTLPDEVVRGVVNEDQLDGAKIVIPSPARVKPVCVHYKSCGGCSLQHASDTFVSAWKADQIAIALAAHGITTDIRATLTSPAHSRKRATFAARRTKSGAMVGVHARTSDVLVPIGECHLLPDEMVATLPVLAEIARLGGSRSAVLGFSLTQSDIGLDLHVTGGKPLDHALRTALPKFRTEFLRLTWGDEVVFMETPPYHQMGRARVTPPAGAFLQATKAGEAALLAAARSAISGATRIIDLFAGCGTFTFPLAETAPVHAVEGSADMVKTLQDAARYADGLKPITAETRDLFRRPVLSDEFAKYDAVVIDPPRAGAQAQVHELARTDIPQIAFLSCNPISFARDAKTLIDAGYCLEWVQPIDQFRWSPHIELAARFIRPLMTR